MGKALIPADAPFGYLPGDNATAPYGPDDCLNIRILKADGSELADPFRVGVTANGHDRSQQLKAQVFPFAEAANVTIEVSSGLTLSDVVPNSSTGVITFRVVGNLTAGSTNEGDQNITASHNVEPYFVRKNVTVVVPFQVGTPHDTAGGGVVVSNQVLGPTSSPAWYGLPAGQVFLATTYKRVLTITVWDKWNHAIGDLYGGAEISENLGSITATINQFLSSASTYSDPVGYAEPRTSGPSVVAAGSADAVAWPSAPQVPLQGTVGPSAQNIDVFVDGFPLNPAIVNRTVTVSPPSSVTITWP
jgi:hypothetical protein